LFFKSFKADILEKPVLWITIEAPSIENPVFSQKLPSPRQPGSFIE
jgi:hypothetical protein